MVAPGADANIPQRQVSKKASLESVLGSVDVAAKLEQAGCDTISALLEIADWEDDRKREFFESCVSLSPFWVMKMLHTLTGKYYYNFREHHPLTFAQVTELADDMEETAETEDVQDVEDAEDVEDVEDVEDAEGAGTAKRAESVEV